MQKSKKECYESFVTHQKNGYEITARLIGYVIEKMKTFGLISEHVKITGRIKSYKSVIANDKKKTIDDCFGIRIIGTEQEIEKIKEELAKVLLIDCVKDHKKCKNSNYKGLHQMVHIKKQFTEGKNIDYDLFPEIEVQYWTKQMEKDCTDGWLSYSHYKKEQFEKVIHELKQDRKAVLNQLPTYYEIKGTEMLEYFPEETLYKLYPEIRRMEIKEEISNDERNIE